MRLTHCENRLGVIRVSNGYDAGDDEIESSDIVRSSKDLREKTYLRFIVSKL